MEEKVEKAYESTIEEEIYEPSQELVDAYEEEEIDCEEEEQGDERNESVEEYLEIGVNLEEAEFNNELKEVDFEPIEVSKEVIIEENIIKDPIKKNNIEEITLTNEKTTIDKL